MKLNPLWRETEMPNQKTLMTMAITVLVTLVLANKLRSLPLVSKLPTV